MSPDALYGTPSRCMYTNDGWMRPVGYGLNNKRNLPEWYYSNPQPVILKYDGANLEHIRVAELKCMC